MKTEIKSLTAIALLTLGLSACQTTGAANSSSDENFMPIATLTAFEGGIIGKTLTSTDSDTNQITISPDGTWSGVWDGSNIGGEWVWEDGAFCRTLSGRPRDCQTWELSSRFDKARVTRDRGAGKSLVYVIGM